MNFNITTPFDSEIEQLKAKLAELETQKHRLATCANRIVEQVVECVIEMKQAGVSDGVLSNWACVIYREVTGEDVPKFSDSAALKGANLGIQQAEKLIAQLTQERNKALDDFVKLTEASVRSSEILKTAREEISQLKSDFETVAAQRDHYQEELEKLQSGNRESSDNSLIEGYKKTITELTIANQKLTEEVLELRGESPRIILKEPKFLTEETDAQPEELNEDPRQDAAFLEATNNQLIVSEFLRKLDRIARVDKLDWQKIKELPLNLETMRELGLQVSSKSKTHKYLLEQMPVMCAKYINKTGDNSDLDWLPGHFVESVREALSTESDNESTSEEEEAKKSPRSTSLSEVKPVFQRGDAVRHVNHNVARLHSKDEAWTVLDVNGEWINVKDSDGLTDMWNISDVELAA